jgi:hypothetical protein
VSEIQFIDHRERNFLRFQDFDLAIDGGRRIHRADFRNRRDVLNGADLPAVDHDASGRREQRH